jgi:fructoselysine-6-P-deglycase FrlB-like protein
MFEGSKEAAIKARKIVRKLSNYRGNKTHSRHIHFDELKAIGLKVTLIEDDQKLQDLILTVHHCYMHALMNTPAFKIIENHKNSAFIKMQFIPPIQQQR